MAETQDITKSNSIPIGYKQTALGVIPEDWEVVHVEDVAFVDKESLNGNTDPDYTFEYISLSDVDEKVYSTNTVQFKNAPSRARRLVFGGDIIMSTVRPNLQGFAMIKDDKRPLVASTGFAVITANKIESTYLFQSLFSDVFSKQFYQLTVGSNYPAINSSDVRKLKVPFPPLPEQQKIAEILSAWDEAITLTKTTIEELKLRNKGLAQQLLTGKKRLKGFSGKWKHLMIGQIAKPLNLTNKKNEDIEVLSCTKYDGLVPSLEYFGRQVFGEDLSKYKIVPNGAFAYATNHIEEGSIGYQNLMDRGLVSPMYTVFETKPGIDDEFLFKLLKSEKLIYSYQSNMSGSINRRGGLRWGDFSKIKIDLPDYNEQIEIAKILNEANVELKILEEKLETLLIQKKGLMQQLLTGEKRVTI